MDAYGLVCICGKTPEQHAGADHPFLEKRPDYDPSTWRRAAFPFPTQEGPPSTVYIQLEDRLQISVVRGPVSTSSLQLGLRILRPDGHIIPFNTTVTVGGIRTAQTQNFDLVEGYLLGLQITDNTIEERGDCYVVAQIIRGQGASAFVTQVLIADWVSKFSPLGWPGGRIAHSVEGQGRISVPSIAAPAAGTELVYTVPSNSRQRVRSITFTLTTAAAVANREVTLILDLGGAAIAQVPSAFTQAASLTRTYSFSLGVQIIQGAQTLLTAIPLPDMALTAGSRARTATTNLQAADQYSAALLFVEEWVEG